MTLQLTEKQALLHNKLWDKATSLTKGDLQLDENDLLKRPGLTAKFRLRRATKLFERILEINPENGPAHVFLAKTLCRLAEHGRALEHYQAAARLMPESAVVAREMILSAMWQGNLEAAVQIGQEGAQRLPSDPGVHVNLGIALLCSGLGIEAVDSFQRALILEPEDAVSPRLAQLAESVARGETAHPRNDEDMAQLLRRLNDED